MLKLPSGSSVVKFVGIDPGTSFPGISIISYDVELQQIVRVAAHCFNLEKLSRRSIHSDYQNPRYLRLQVFRGILKDIFKKERPIKIASEHPYINPRTPGAVIPLAECLFMIEQEVHAYNPYLCLERIDPSSIKNAVGVKGNSGDKEAMTKGIAKIPEIMSVLTMDLTTMDNNAVDSIAVGYCSMKRELSNDYPH